METRRRTWVQNAGSILMTRDPGTTKLLVYTIYVGSYPGSVLCIVFEYSSDDGIRVRTISTQDNALYHVVESGGRSHGGLWLDGTTMICASSFPHFASSILALGTVSVEFGRYVF